MEPGHLALLVLFLSFSFGWVLGCCVLSRSFEIRINESGLQPRARLLVHAVGFSAIALTFWTWALINIYRTRRMDLGAITFAFALFSNVEALHLTKQKSHPPNLPTVRCHRCLCLSSGLAVAANYGYALQMKPDAPIPLRIYFWLGLALWLFAGFRARCLILDDFAETCGGPSEAQRLAPRC